MAVDQPQNSPEEALQQSVAKPEEAAEETADVVELEALRVENEELIDTVQRVKAEFDNYRKRAAG
jgi:molecular chaperone GrpE (heat shock protein)